METPPPSKHHHFYLAVKKCNNGVQSLSEPKKWKKETF